MKTLTPKYIFEKGNRTLNDISNSLKIASRIILFLDYDGTLVPIMKDRAAAVLSRQMEVLLHDLNNIKNNSIYLVTGRAYSDIKKVFRVKGITIASNHGFQITGKNIKWVHPETKKFLPSLTQTRLLLVKKLRSIPLAVVEDKQVTITVHYRNVDKISIPQVKKTVKDVVVHFSKDLHTTLGKKVIEIRPNIEWNKGEAVFKILKSLRIRNASTMILYIGDDKTDEDAFKMLKQNAITIVVGRKQNSHANFYFRNTNEVQKLLELIFSFKRERN